CFQAEDGIRDPLVTGVQTCALPIWTPLTVDNLEDALQDLRLAEVPVALGIMPSVAELHQKEAGSQLFGNLEVLPQFLPSPEDAVARRIDSLEVVVDPDEQGAAVKHVEIVPLKSFARLGKAGH